MFKLSLKKKLFRICAMVFCFVAIGVATVGFLISKQNQDDVRAITGDGQNVTVLRTGHPDVGPGFHEFFIDSRDKHGFCAQTSKDIPQDNASYPAHKLGTSSDHKYEKIQLIIFINEYGDESSLAAAARTELFGNHDWTYYYRYTHYTISAIYDNDYTLGDRTIIDNAITKLDNYINNNADVWIAAQNYQLYRIQPGSTMQDLVWIEDKSTYGSIKVKKCDASTNTCAAQSPLSLAGISFEVYNASGSKIYNTKTNQIYNNGAVVASGTTNNDGEIIFTNILADNKQYRVKETQTNQWYQLDAAEQTVTLTTAGETKTLSFYDSQSVGKITVKKIDADTGSCTDRTSNLSFDGITFTLTKDGNTIASQSLSTNCSVTFEGLPYGNYTISESNVPSGYNSAANQTVSLTASDHNKTVTFSNTPKKGKITVTKKDADTNSCSAVGNASLNGTIFKLINKTGGKVKVGNQTYNNNAEITSATLASSDNCIVEFTGLPYGTYSVEETPTAGYGTTVVTKSVTVNGATASVSFTNTVIKGKITVNKTDSATGTCDTQGNATFNGTTFKLTNRSTNKIIYDGRTIAPGNEVATKTIPGDAINSSNPCTVSFENLPYGKYELEETAVGSGYNRNTEKKTITITNNGENKTETFANTVIIGKLTVKIIDEDTGSCVNTRGLTFENAKFTVKNTSDKPIYHNNTRIDPGQSFVTGTYGPDGSDNDCSITIDDLPIGDYEVTQTGGTPGYTPDPNTYNPSITVDDLHPEVTLIDKPMRGDVRFVKMDAENNKPMRDVMFSISAIDDEFNIIETHIVVSNLEGVIDTSSDFALHSNHTNGYDALDDEVDPISFLGYGTWFGTDELGNPIRTADNERALPYGKYLIQELRCGSNRFCYGVLNQKRTITINSANQVIDLGDWNNACDNFSLDTTATDAKDGDHYIELGEKVEIEDTIDYCVKPNTNFILKGVLMDKATGEPYLVNGEPVENSIKLRSAEDCGQTKMTFTLEGTEELAGKELVVFESLYYTDGFNTSLITRHDDINDDNQTVTIIKLVTLATNDATGEKVLPLNADVAIKDHITYCLKPGVEYTLKSVLMNKNTGTGLLINSEPVEIETTLNPTETCGEKDIYFHINTADLGGADLVIFESLYEDDELILEHRDFNNYDETVSVAPPAPDTGFMTRLISDGGNTKIVFIIAGGIVFLGVGGYFTSRHFAKKKFMKKF